MRQVENIIGLSLEEANVEMAIVAYLAHKHNGWQSGLEYLSEKIWGLLK